jgi:two-component system OmpR family sensor kinase
LNHLLDHVDDAFRTRFESEEKMRRFVADASHELRTPLAAIRGYAELTKRSGQKLSPELTQALGRIESESVRMTSLVEDLLLLARLDEGHPLTKKPADLAEIIRDALSDAYVTSPEREWGAVGVDNPVVIEGDAESLYQVVANLLANARMHTPEGTNIEVRLVEKPRTILIEVEDSGPGISKEIRQQLFERFARGDSSRARRSGSTGLGLAIVDTIVSAHGGSVAVASKPGKTVFTVALPKP